VWLHSLSLQDRSLLAWDAEPLAALGAVPLLVLELARWQLRSLLAEDSQASSESVVVAEAEAYSEELLPADGGERP